MNRKKTIRKAIIIGACLLAGGGITTLLVAASRKEATHYCKSIDVAIKGSGEKAFISKKDILAQLQKTANGSIVDKRIETIDVAKLETALEKHQWIRDAELYFDTHDVLHVIVLEREPIARLFTTAGSSFYMDSAGQRMPLLATVSVRVPVVTGLGPSKKWSRRDSAFVKDIITIAGYINTHPFWSAQIAQIDITSAGTFELLPVVGNHIIRIGRAENIEAKLANLLIFYKQVLRQTGFDKYAVVDVQYRDQVVGSHERTVSAIDSVQLQRNIQELIRKTRLQAEADSLAFVEITKAAAKDSAAQKEREALAEPLTEMKAADGKTQVAPVVKKSNAIKANRPVADKKPAPRKQPPKAIMKKRNA